VKLYDDDIKWGRRIGFFLCAANLIAGVLNLWQRNWYVALACFIWGFNSSQLISIAKKEQALRDRWRIMEAILNGRLKQEK
jgi:hypothetical protein